MKKYNIINNSLGWLCFVIAAVTYLLTIEPTASFWDCPEFISQGYKLEVGHPPGNPIWIMTARFFINFTGGDPTKAAIAVNVMSALLSAATILLLFWTITHLMRRLLVGRSQEELSAAQTIVVMSAGLVGALLYTWSDTFWFSAVESEVYAFSSFCTALVFWLILKWDNRADQPHSDRYLVLVAYVIGISIAVHLLNLLTIPALALVVYYRKVKEPNFAKSLLTLLASFVIIALILYGLVPGFVENAQHFELFFVNKLHMSYNVGVIIYAVMLVGVLIWCVNALYRQKNLTEIRMSFIFSVILSGIPFIGSSWVVHILIICGLVAYMIFSRKLSVRLLTITALSILVIFVGYSSYALLLIRSTANPPMNQNAPDNVFALSSYLNREQYGKTPLLYGPSFGSTPMVLYNPETGAQEYASKETKTEYAKVVKTSPDEPDRYVEVEGQPEYKMTPNMFFPRMYSSQGGHPAAYAGWVNETLETMPKEKVTPYIDMRTGEPLRMQGETVTASVTQPTFAQNMQYFLNYQLNYMYWRYFMWNFAGRQNDIQGQGEVNRGNWISGIPAIDNARLGDQSLLPDDMGKNNKGHNVFYMLPLLLGLLGIVTQIIRGVEGARQFWIVFLLFFMTGIAIVLYLNQPPLQPRERDYAFAGSFYAFSIWIGLGVYVVYRLFNIIFGSKKEGKSPVIAAAIAGVVCLLVPLQVVSQTWDDHDRSGRYAARDFGMNYLSSLDENAVIFTNGDNDTFPLWYAQEVEGYRTDVRVVNLAYLSTDWYANHVKMPANDAAPLKTLAEPIDYAYNRLQYSFIDPDPDVTVPVDALKSLEDLYRSPSAEYMKDYRVMRYPYVYIPVNIDAAVEKGVITPEQAKDADDAIFIDLTDQRAVTLSGALSLDIIANGISDDWSRPAYFAMTVPDEYYLNLQDYLRNTGLAYQVTPVASSEEVSSDKMYDNVMNKFRWGGLDQLGDDGDLYLDETVRRMVSTHRTAMLDLATQLYAEGAAALYDDNGDDKQLTPAERARATERLQMAVNVLRTMEEKLPARVSPYLIQIPQRLGTLYVALGDELGDEQLRAHGFEILSDEIMRYLQYIPYYESLIRSEKQRVARAKSRYYADRIGLSSLNLAYADRYVPSYILALVGTYRDYNGDMTALAERMSVYGGDIMERVSNMR